MKKSNMKTLTNSLFLCGMLTLASCSGGSGGGGSYGGGGSTSTYGTYSSPLASANQFVDSLNYVDGANSFVELYGDETIRSAVPGEDTWFVIWDDKYGENKAVSLEYIRSIVYYDYMSNTDALASEFRAIESDDIAAGDLYGDYYGNDYEVVDYDPISGIYYGVNSGFEYEDSEETTDVSLMAAESQEMKFFKKASAISYEFSVSISTAMGLVTLGDKVSSMTAKGDLSAEDMAVIGADIEKLTSVSVADLMVAAVDSAAKDAAVEKAAAKLGTTAANIEQRILPELVGIELQ
ncbi:MAG: hypothetical protein VYA54_09425 [Bdellovibrionota bacterium]|nr:hypothetical protein [Bdellovibrionota bacterium]